MTINAEVQNNSYKPFDITIKRFRKQVKQSGVLEDLKDRAYYEKPSSKKNRINAQRKKKNANNSN